MGSYYADMRDKYSRVIRKLDKALSNATNCYGNIVSEFKTEQLYIKGKMFSETEYYGMDRTDFGSEKYFADSNGTGSLMRIYNTKTDQFISKVNNLLNYYYKVITDAKNNLNIAYDRLAYYEEQYRLEEERRRAEEERRRAEEEARRKEAESEKKKNENKSNVK